MDNNTKKESKMREKMQKEQERLEKQREKEIIREEKERVRNSFWYKIKSFILTLIFVIILIVASFFGLKYYLNEKKQELYKEEMSYYYEEGQKLLQKEEYEKAIKMLNKVEKESDNYNKAKEKINEAIDRFLGSYMDTAKIYIAEKDYDRALNLFSSLPEEIKSTENVQDFLADINYLIVENKISEIDSYYKKILKIGECINENLDNKSKDRINELLSENIDQYFNEVNENISSKTYEKYSEELREILNRINNDRMVQLQEIIKEYEPLSLVTLDYKKAEEIIEVSSKNSSTQDLKSEKYTNFILVNQTSKHKENTIIWNLDGKYNELSGKICLSKKVKKITSKGVKVTIYGNDRVIYRSKKIKDGTNPFMFNIDITGVTELKIVLESDKGISYFIANPMLIK